MSDAIKPTQHKDFAGKSTQEMFDFLKEEGAELTEEQLEMVSGGDAWEDTGFCFCPKCDNLCTVVYPDTTAYCKCGHSFPVQW